MKKGDVVVVWNYDNPDDRELTIFLRKDSEKFVCLNTLFSLNEFLERKDVHEWVFDNAELYENTCTPKVKNPVEIMAHLLDQGYEVDHLGEWCTESDKVCFIPEMWQYCGKEKPDKWKWEPEWLE